MGSLLRTSCRSDCKDLLFDSLTCALKRTGLEIPPECDPDIPSRRESNLSASDWDPDMEDDYHTYSFGHGVDRLPVLEETELHTAFALKGIPIDENEMSTSSLPNDDLPEEVKEEETSLASSQKDIPSGQASGSESRGQPQPVEIGHEWWRRCELAFFPDYRLGSEYLSLRSGGDFHMDLELSPVEARIGTGLLLCSSSCWERCLSFGSSLGSEVGVDIPGMVRALRFRSEQRERVPSPDVTTTATTTATTMFTLQQRREG
eukprot:45193-Hanusia_phi.AAC.2